MKGFLASTAAGILGTKLFGCDAEILSVVTDSRETAAGALFVAIKGDTFDGHDFIGAAFHSGAVCAIAERQCEIPEGKGLILVPDAKRAMGDLARAYRDNLSTKIVAVTGSVGKTTTKEFIYSVLSKGGKASKTKNSFNNDIGLPLTLFSLEGDEKFAAIELGMNHFHEMERLADIARPDIAVIMNIGVAHIENLGSREGILKAKLEILSGLKEGGTVLLCGDDDLLWGLRGTLPFNTVYFGIENEACDFVAQDIEEGESSASFAIKKPREIAVTMGVAGRHNVYNALAAAAVGIVCGLSDDEIKEGILSFKTAYGRQDIYKKGGVTFIDDTYNANPDSMAAAIKVLCAQKGRKIAVLGDMMELGEFSDDAHMRVGEICASEGVDILFAFGERSFLTALGAAHARYGMWANAFFDKKELADRVIKEIKPGDAILFKGSRAMKMEEVLNMIQKGYDFNA